MFRHQFTRNWCCPPRTTPPHLRERRLRKLRRPSLRQLWIVLAVSALMAACGGDGSVENGETAATSETTSRSSPTSSASSTTTSPSTTSSPTTEGIDSRVEAAYLAAGDAFMAVATVPDPNDPRLAATHIDPMLEQRRLVLLGRQADGRIIRYPPDSQYEVVVETVEVDGAVARLTFCAIDDGERVVVGTGEVVASGIAKVEGRAAMRLQDGVWRLAEQEFDSREPGVAEC